MTVTVGVIVQSQTEGAGGTGHATMLMSMVNTLLAELKTQMDSHGTMPNLVQGTTPSRWLK